MQTRFATLRPPRPWSFFVLVLPYGASFGFVSGAFPLLAREDGISVEAIAIVVSTAFIPHTPKFLWAPLVDMTWSRKTWYRVSLALVSLGTFASMAMPISTPRLGALTAVIVVSQIGLTTMGMSIEGLIGRSVPAESKGTTAGWFQAGSFVGVGLGGGAAYWLVQRFGGPVGGALLAAAFLACALPLIGLDEAPETTERKLGDAIAGLARDLGSLVRSPGGIAAIVICLSPIGAGAAANIFGAIAEDWRASAGLAVAVTTTLGSLAAAAGAAWGGWLAARVGRRSAYALGGALTAAAGVAMALAPHAAWTYALFTLTYQAFNGAAFAAFSAFAFEIAGRESVATKYNILASLANVAIAYTVRADGAAYTRWGARGALLADAALTAAGIAVLAASIAITRPKPRSGPYAG